MMKAIRTAAIAVLLVLLGVRVQFAGFASFGAITGGIGGIGTNQTGSDGLINVKNYGVKGDGSTDDTTAIQNAINTACSTSGSAPDNGYPYPTLFFPCGKYITTAPIIQTCTLRMVGDSRFCAGWDHTSDYFPIFTYVGSGYISGGANLSASPLVSGSTYAMNWDAVSGDGYFYNLKEAIIGTTLPTITAPLNGLSEFTAEAFVNFAAGGTVGNSYYLTDSAENYLGPTPGSVQRDFSIYVVQQSSSSDLHAILNLSGGSVSLTASSALPNATTKHIALTYDGSTVRLFVAGQVVASASGSGTLVQPESSSWLLGDQYYGDLAAYGAQTNWDGQVQSFRVSNTARYTSNFTPPTTALSSDSNTLLLLNTNAFNNNLFQQVTYVADGRSGTGAYLFPYRENLFGGSEGGQIENMAFDDGSIGFLQATGQNIVVKNVSLYDVLVGLKTWNYTYQNHFENVTVSGYEAGMEVTINSEADVHNYTDLSVGLYGFVFGPVSNGALYDSFIQGTSYQLAGIVALNGGLFQNVVEDDETNSAAVGAITSGQTQFINSALEVYGGESDGSCVHDEPVVKNLSGPVTLTNSVAEMCAAASSPVVYMANSAASANFEHSFVNGVPADSSSVPVSLGSYTYTTTVDNAPPSGTVSELPSNPRVGALFDITDCGTCSFGSTCTHSASPVALCPEKYNGSAWVAY